ncbi:MAG: fibronectin type III domain-containing protein [Dehalococcoidia bacterium]|nr:fibronectin type III domain-containing protein [Dehalococcoidia bacterium]
MTYKTRKHIWPVALMSLAVFGVLATVVALSVVQAQVAQADGCDTGTAEERSQCDTDHEQARLDHTDPDHTHPEPEPSPEPEPVTEGHASMPVMFMAEGLDNGARLSWAQPKLRAPGASVIGYRIGRDAWTSDPDHPINRFGDDVIDLLNLPSVLAADYSDRGLAYNTVYTYAVRAIVEYDVKYWWNNLTPAMRTSLVSSSEGMAYAGLSEDVMAAVQRVYGLQAGKYPTAMVDTWWDNLNCVQMNDAVSPMAGEPAVGSDDPDNNPRSPYCYMYDDLSPAAAAVVYRAHYNSYNRYAFGAWSYGRSITTATSGGLLDALLAPPSAPRDLDAMPSCDDQIMITWKAPVDNGKVPAEFPGCATCTNRTPTHIGGDDAGIEIQPGTARITGYMVDRKVGNGAWMTLDSNVTGTSYVDDSDDLAYGMTYHYRVRATNNANLTGPAGMVSETLERPMGAQVPTSPDADPSPDNPAHVLFTWDPPGTAAGNAAWRTEDDVDTDNDNESKSASAPPPG